MKRVSLMCGIAAVAALTAAAAGSAVPLPGGPAFSDPGKVVEMPPAWHERGVHYQEWARDADLAVTLDQHLYPALLPLVREYARERDIRVAVHEGTCGISAGKLEEKAADMGGFCCPPGATDRLPGLRFHTLGIAALALLVHPENPVENVSLETARAIFRGERYRWSDVDPKGDGGLITPVGRLHCKARPGHWRLLLDNEDLFSPRLFEVSTIADMIAAVARNPRAIGYEVVWNIARHAGEGRVEVLRVDGRDPRDRAAVTAGDYALYRVYNVTTWTPAHLQNDHADDLVEYLYRNSDRIEGRYGIIPAGRLRDAGWRFRGNELAGAPGE